MKAAVRATRSSSRRRRRISVGALHVISRNILRDRERLPLDRPRRKPGLPALRGLSRGEPPG